MDINKPCGGDAVFHLVDGIKWFAHLFGAKMIQCTRLSKDGVDGKSSVITSSTLWKVSVLHARRVEIETYVISGSNCSIHPPGTRFLQQKSVNTLIKKLLRIFILKSLLVDPRPLSVSKGAKQISCVFVRRHLHQEGRAPTHENQIEFSFLGEHPLLEHIVDFKLAVRWHPGVWRRGKIHALHKCLWQHVRHLNSPHAAASSDIKNVLSCLRDWTPKQGVLLLGIENTVDDMGGVHRLKLVLMVREMVLWLYKTLLPASRHLVPNIRLLANSDTCDHSLRSLRR